MQPDGGLLGGRYELTALIATGGMGQVWQARDTVLNRDVAVKVLRSEYTGDPSFLTRFRAEAQLAAGLVHPNIATLFDYGEVEPQGPTGEHLAYLVMELVRGESLADLLRRDHRLPADRTLQVLRESAAGLGAAHAAGVVHRDVKPGNVLLAADGQVKLTDFGVAVSAASVPLTRTGEVMGTANYLSPEQAEGKKATPASDVYALGLVGYECLAGRRAFDGESPVQVALRQIRELPPALPGDVPDAVRRLIGRAIVKDSAERFADGATFRAAIDDVLTGRPIGSAVREPRTAVLAAVPAAGATASHPATRVLPAVTATPAPDPDPDEPDSEGRRRRGLLALVALLAVAAVLAGGLWLTNRGTGDGGAATGPTTAATSSRPSAPPATPSAQLVDLSSSDYVGKPASEVLAALQARGLVVTLVPLQTADVPDGQVIAVDPAGKLAPNSPVAVTYAVTPPAPPTPTATARATATATAGGNNGHGNGETKGKGNGKGDD